MKSCIALGSPCLTPVEIERRAKSRFLKQTTPLDVRCKFFTSLLKETWRFICLSTQKRYFREREGKAEAISRAKMPLLGTFLTMKSMTLASRVKIRSIICFPFIPPAWREVMHLEHTEERKRETIQDMILQSVLARLRGLVLLGCLLQFPD